MASRRRGVPTDRESERGGDGNRYPWLPVGDALRKCLHASRWHRLPDLRGDGARGRVPDELLPDPRPDAEWTRRGRRIPNLDPPPRRIRQPVTSEGLLV